MGDIMTTSNRSSSAGKAARPSVRRAHISAPKTWEEKDPAVVPLPVQFALRDAMRLEEIPLTQYDAFLWIIAQESSGVVGCVIAARQRVACFSYCAHNMS